MELQEGQVTELGGSFGNLCRVYSKSIRDFVVNDTMHSKERWPRVGSWGMSSVKPDEKNSNFVRKIRKRSKIR